MTPAQKTLIEVTMRSLRQNPDDWKITKYTATNDKLGIEVWLANRYYGTRVNAAGLQAGGLDADSEWFGRFRPWRRELIRAVEVVAVLRLTRATPLATT